MANHQLGAVVQSLRRSAAHNGADADLLDEFVHGGDQVAFEALLKRHGPMVMGVCRRVAQHAQDAEDAFQATFLILARKAASLARKELLSGWLYGVAFRVARRSRTMAARRYSRERPYVEQPGKNGDALWSDLEPLLDQELHRLPKAFQQPILLCDLQGKSRRDAALVIGVPEGTLSSRLARGRELLRARLARRGVALGTVALAGFLATNSQAAVDHALAASTAQTATTFATGSTAGVSANVATLVQGGLKSLLLVKLQIGAAVLLMSAGLWCAQPAPEAETPAAATVVALAPQPAPERAAAAHEEEADGAGQDDWEVPDKDPEDNDVVPAQAPRAEVPPASRTPPAEVERTPPAPRVASRHHCHHSRTLARP
jgi:RNA polymerase sigma factor (sigma-70 family)